MVALILTLVQSNSAILIGSVLSGSACATGVPAARTARLKTAALTAPDNKLFIFGLPVAPAFGPGDALSSRRFLDCYGSLVMRVRMGMHASSLRNSNIKHEVGAVRKDKTGQRMWIWRQNASSGKASVLSPPPITRAASLVASIRILLLKKAAVAAFAATKSGARPD